MSDIIDQANDLTEQLTTAYVAYQRSKNHALPYVGQCYNCHAATPDGHNFCDADCRDDWQKRRRAQQRNGNV